MLAQKICAESGFNRRVPYVGISVLFAAYRLNLLALLSLKMYLAGEMDVSAPESERNFIPEILSIIKRRFLALEPLSNG